MQDQGGKVVFGSDDKIVVFEGRKFLNFSEQEFSVWVPIQMRFCDTDMMGHINNVSVIAFLETARVEYMSRMRDVAKQKGIGRDLFSIILAEITCVYRGQIFLRDKIQVGIKIRCFKRKSFVFDYIILADQEDGIKRKVVDAQSIQVMYDYFEGKSIDVPKEFIEVAEIVEGRKIPFLTNI
jgi:acyl-CoA thioester hydrolase